METMKTFQDVEVMLPSKWAAKYRPKAFRPAAVGDWVYVPIADHVLKLSTDHTSILGACHLILEPILPDPKEWWPKWLKARWLFGGQDSLGERAWFVSNAEEAPTPKPFGDECRDVSWGYRGVSYSMKTFQDVKVPCLPLSQWMSLLSPNLLDLSFIPEVMSKRACFKNPWLDEEKTP